MVQIFAFLTKNRMEEKKGTRALPRFHPLTNKRNISETSKVRAIPVSSSMPSISAFAPKVRPQKKPKPQQIIEFSDAVKTSRPRVTNASQVTPEFYIPLHRTEEREIFSVDSDDKPRNIKLPLVPVEEQTKPIAEILTEGSPKFVIVQLPSSLPIKYPNDMGQMEANPLVGATDGHLGKIQIHKSGKVTAKIGKNNFDIVSGTFASCEQLLCSESEMGGLKWSPLSGEKIILTLDIPKMIDQIDNESD